MLNRFAVNLDRRHNRSGDRRRELLAGLFACFATLLSASGASSEAPPLSSIGQVRSLAPAEAAAGQPVRIRAVVTFHNSRPDCFVEDATGGIYVARPGASEPLTMGELVEIEGTTGAGDFAPIIREHKVRRLGPGSLPAPIEPTFEQLLAGREDSRWVEVRGVVRFVLDVRPSHVLIQLKMLDGKLDCYLYDWQEPELSQWVGAAVRLRGAVGGTFNQNRQLVAPRLFVHASTGVFIEAPAPEDPFAAPAQPVRSLITYTTAAGIRPRAKCRGVVTHQQPGHSLFIRDDTHGLYIQTRQTNRLAVGDRVEALGFPRMGVYTPLLEDAVFRRIGAGTNPAPTRISASDVLLGERDSDLVAVKAQLLETATGVQEQILVLQSGSLVFSAHLADKDFAPIRNGSQLEVTGVCLIQEVIDLDGTLEPSSFRMLLRTAGDIRVLQQPSIWTVPRLLWTLGGMAIVILAVLFWVWVLNRRVRQQTALIGQKLQREAALEERTRLAREIHDSLEQELAGITMQLDTAAAKLGTAPDMAARSLTLARQMIRRSQSEVHRSVWDLRSNALEFEGLDAALEKTAASLASGFRKITVQAPPEFPRLPGWMENHLLRIGQEALNNAVRHGEAKSITIELRIAANQLSMLIRDDGIGFDVQHPPTAQPGCFGLLGMHERAEKLGGQVTIRSQPGAGTDIEVSVPIPPTQQLTGSGL